MNSGQPNQPLNPYAQMPQYPPNYGVQPVQAIIVNPGVFSSPVICYSCGIQTFGVVRRIVTPLCTVCGLLLIPLGFLICWLGGSKIVTCCHACLKPLDPNVKVCFGCQG